MLSKRESGWKELKIDDLPSDILVGDYEFEYFNETMDEEMSCWFPQDDGITAIQECFDNKCDTRYRKRQQEKKAPSHEEIMTKWWKTDKNDCWVKPVQYFDGFYGFANTVYPIPVKNQCKEWFIGRESADIPPENAE